MKPEWKRYAFIGLIVGVVGLVFSAGLYFVRREFDLIQQISLALTVIGFASYALLNPDAIRNFFTGRQLKYGSNALVFLLAIAGILIITNYLVIQNPQRWDLTEDKANTLSPETLEILQALPEPVFVQAFYSDTNTNSAAIANETLNSLKINSDGKLDYEFLNPLIDIEAAQNAEIVQDGSVVLWLGDQKQTITYASESEITAALYRLMSGEVQYVYFLTGHGEYNPDETGDNGYSYIKQMLEAKQYVISTLNLATNKVIPEDADLIVIAGPIYPVTADEVTLIDAFLQSGGSLIVEEEPLFVTQFGDAKDPLAAYLAEGWGIVLEDTLVLDSNSSIGSFPFIYSTNPHTITNHMEANLSPFFPTARSLSVTEVADVTQTELLFTAPDASWGEVNWQELAENADIVPEADPETDILGPLALLVVAENASTDSRVAVFGDSDFASDTYFQQQGNGEVLTLTVDWAAAQENTISLTTESATVRSVVPPTQAGVYLLYMLALCIFPGALLVMMFVVWYLKKKRG